jgi:hypothetical protein
MILYIVSQTYDGLLLELMLGYYLKSLSKKLQSSIARSLAPLHEPLCSRVQKVAEIGSAGKSGEYSFLKLWLSEAQTTVM